MLGIGAVFERIPERFIEEYQVELLDWATRFREIGPVGTIRLRPIAGVPIEMNPHPAMGPVVMAVRLQADRRVRLNGDVEIVISPADTMSAELLARHVAEMGVARAPQ